jgi:hypothetical protein
LQYKPYVPQNIGELMDHLSYMMLYSPTFKDKTGYFPQRNVDTAFVSLNEGLLVVRTKLGEERYAMLSAMSDKMRALFEADPDDTTGDARAGRKIIREMEDILKNMSKRRPSG